MIQKNSMKSCQEHRMSNNNHSKDDGFESFVAFDSLLNTLDGAALVSTRNMKQKRKPKNKMTATKNSNTKFQLKQNYYSTAKRLKIEASSQSILDGVKMIREPNRSKVSQYLNEIKPGKDSNHDVCINGNRNQIFIKPTHTASELLNCSNLNNNNVKKQGVHPVTNKKIVTENSDSVNLKNPTNQSLPMTIHDCKSHHPLYKKISFENHNNRFFNTVQINESSVINSIQKHDDTQTPGATNGMENALMTNQNNGHLTKNPTYQSCSWVSKLYSQSILSHENRLRKIGKYTSTVTARLNSNPHQVHPNQYSVSHLYTPSDTVRLDLGTSSSSSLTSCFVTCMDFDQDGTYLAVGDSLGYVRIYDFEEIHAADISNSRQFHTSKNAKNNGIKRRKILPCVMFHTGNHRISNIAWCPPSSDDHPAIGQDLLAVSFSNYREVRIYDLSIASESGPRFIALNDSSNVRGSGHSFITFLNDAKATKSTGTNDHPLYLLAGGSDGTVRLWCVPKNVEGKVKLLWSFNPWNSYECGVISDIIQLTSFHPTQKKGLVLISTSMGYFAIINLDRLVHKSFSVSGTPEVISTWSLSQVNELHNTGLPKDCKWIGVKRCFSMTQLVSYKKLSLDFLIVTNAGWVLSMKTIIEKSKSYVVSSRPKCQVLHQTPKMETYSSTGEYYGQDQSTSCVPSFNSIAYYQDSNIPTLIITGIKPNRKYLASSDCRVLDSSSSSPILREPNELLLLNARSLQTLNGTTASNTTTASSSVDNCTEKNRHSIRLVHGSPTHVAIHPGNGFIVVATAQGVGGVLQSSMELLSLRKSRRRDC